MRCALALIENSTLVAAAAASVPLVMETETQSCVLVTDQSSALPPELVKEQTKLEGLNGPPATPLAAKSRSGVTSNWPGVGWTRRMTVRFVSPNPVVRLAMPIRFV